MGPGVAGAAPPLQALPHPACSGTACMAGFHRWGSSGCCSLGRNAAAPAPPRLVVDRVLGVDAGVRAGFGRSCGPAVAAFSLAICRSYTSALLADCSRACSREACMPAAASGWACGLLVALLNGEMDRHGPPQKAGVHFPRGMPSLVPFIPRGHFPEELTDISRRPPQLRRRATRSRTEQMDTAPSTAATAAKRQRNNAGTQPVQLKRRAHAPGNVMSMRPLPTHQKATPHTRSLRHTQREHGHSTCVGR